MPEHAGRKNDHLDLCATDDVAFHDKTTLFEEVTLVHDALPELAVADIDLATEVAGKTLQGPLIIAAMTGGIGEAETVNRELASVAEELGIGFGFGSMRPLLEGGRREGYFVRSEAPTALLFANLGVVQARAASSEQIANMVGETGCDALCVHLNPAMEIIQPEGDDDFRGGLETLTRLSEDLAVPVIAKETGCGISRRTAQRIAGTGVRWVDVSGAGGTSWVGVETLRARARTRQLGERFWDWGIPTAGSVVQLSDLPLKIIATGGVRDGLDIARAIALGAAAGGIARTFLQAWNRDGRRGALSAAREVLDEVRIAHLLCGARTPSDLASTPLHVGNNLARWIPSDSPLRARFTDA